MAQARQHWQATQKRCQRREKAWHQALKKLAKTHACLTELQTERDHLQTRLARFEQDNQTNADLLIIEFRLDAGFGACENLALLMEMGYDLYTKPYSHRVVAYLKSQVLSQTPWTRCRLTISVMAR